VGGRRQIYDRLKTEAAEGVQEAYADGSLDAIVARVNAWLCALREQGHHHGLAIGDGPHLCVTCAVPWPCKKVRSEIPSLR
jgi:hypothetical protein